MKKIKINEKEFEVIKDYKDAIEIEKIEELYTDYFENYDYILGDWAYGKLRLKGFCDKTNKQNNKINSYDLIEEYIKKIEKIQKEDVINIARKVSINTIYFLKD